MNKYRNIKTVVDGHIFDSKKEASRYIQLKHLEKNGEITDLELQPRFVLTWGDGEPLYIQGEKRRTKLTYVADFRYSEWQNGEKVIVVEDVKGMKTRVYKIKKAIMEAMGHTIREI